MSQSVASRRQALRAGIYAFAGAAITAPKLASAVVGATPQETQGPYWVDEKLDRSDIRSDPSTGTVQAGFPLKLNVGVVKLANGKSTAVNGALVDIWHCNAYGNYSDEPAGSGNANTKGQKWLRGYQVTNANGLVRFTTIYPGWYNGRTVHIHARVRIVSGTTVKTNFTTQFFFDDAFTTALYAKHSPYKSRTGRTTLNKNDNVYNTVTSSVGSTTTNPDGTKLLLRYSADASHVVGNFQIVLA
ncbi:MAG: hypothetical protein JWM57_3302 [Phycisphaerales bacterium]|nr:hypothetical protein [Phycisphaerales bacterium]